MAYAEMTAPQDDLRWIGQDGNAIPYTQLDARTLEDELPDEDADAVEDEDELEDEDDDYDEDDEDDDEEEDEEDEE